MTQIIQSILQTFMKSVIESHLNILPSHSTVTCYVLCILKRLFYFESGTFVQVVHLRDEGIRDQWLLGKMNFRVNLWDDYYGSYRLWLHIQYNSNLHSLKNGRWEVLYTHCLKAILGYISLEFQATLVYRMSKLLNHRSDLETESSFGYKHL